MSEDPALELHEPRPGLQPELFGKCLPGFLVNVQGGRLLPRAVEGQHELPSKLLAERVGRDQTLELVDQLDA